jgi:hypothetical protein
MPDAVPAITFARPQLTPIAGEPNNSTLKLLQAELNSNAISIPSNRGGGAHGHLALIQDPTTYLALTGAAFNSPAHPGLSPTLVANATGNQITEANRQYQADQGEYALFLAVERTLKAQLIAAIDSLYINELRDDTMGFANATTLQLLTHLHATYGEVRSDHLEANAMRLDRLWNPLDPIETVWINAQECRRFAAAGLDPISESTAVRKTVSMFDKLGVFADAIRDWRKRPDAEWTWSNLKTDFARANRERLRLLTSERAGYHGANSAAQAATDAATAAAAAAHAAAATALAAVSSNTGTSTPASSATPSGFHYCWSHGLGRSKNHTSATCNTPAPGHCSDATLTNMKGGNNNISRGRNEKPVFRHTPR